MTATYAGDANHTGSSGSATISIGQASSSVTATGGNFTYDGTTHTGGSAVVSGAGIVTGSAVLSYTGDQVDAGSYTVTATYAGDANHTGSSNSASITIGQASSSVTATGGNFTYDGTTHTGGSAVVSGAGVVTGSAVLSYTGDQIDAGSYTVTATYAGDANHTGSSNSATITIGKASSTTTATGAAFTYDGTTHTGGTAVVSGAGTVTGSAVLSYTGDQIDAGSYTVTATYTGDVNHTGSSNSATITIGKASSTTTTVGAGPFTYTGSAHIGGSGTVSGAGGLSTSAASLTYSANANGTGTADQTDAGAYYVTAHYAGDANHLPSDGAAVAVTINRFAFSYTIHNDSQTEGTPANLTSDLPSTIATGVGSQNLAIAYNSIGDTGAAQEGTYPITGVLSNGTGLAANYNVSLTNGTLTVNDAPLSATGTAVTATEGAAFSNVQVGTLTDAAGSYSNPSNLSATINWGDSTAATAATLVEVGATGVFTVKGSHTYGAYGSYTISVSYRDVGGSTTTSTSTATVADASLSATGKAVTATEGAAFSNVQVGTLTDAAGSYSNPANLSATINWGDSKATSLATLVEQGSTGVYTVEGSHTYAKYGSYTITVTCKDAGGSTTASSSTATVADAALTAGA